MSQGSPCLPSGWRMISLGETLSRIDAGVSPKALERPAQPHELGVLKVSAVTWNEFRPDQNKALPENYNAKDCPRVHQGDLLLSRANTAELLASPVLVKKNYPNLLLSDKTLRLLPKQEIAHPSYLLYVLRTATVRRYFESHATGTSGSMCNVSQETIRACPIPLPPLPEQWRIAAILDQAEALRAKRRQALANMELIEALIFEYTINCATTKKDSKRLGDVIEGFRYGTSNKSSQFGYPTLRIPNIINNVLSLNEIKSVVVSEDEFERLRLRNGDLLIVRTNGNPDFVGRSAIFDVKNAVRAGMNPEQFIFASYLIRIRLAGNLILPIVVQAFLSSRDGRRELRARCKTSAGQFNINTEGLSEILIPVPPLSLQEKFAAQVAAVERLKAAHRASLAKLDELFASLQHRAFRGELTAPKGPTGQLPLALD